MKVPPIFRERTFDGAVYASCVIKAVVANPFGHRNAIARHIAPYDFAETALCNKKKMHFAQPRPQERATAQFMRRCAEAVGCEAGWRDLEDLGAAGALSELTQARSSRGQLGSGIT